MKLSELRNGAVVKARNGYRFLKVDNTFLDVNMSGMYMSVDEYNEDLTCPLDKDFSIIAVNNDVKNSNGCLNMAIYATCRGKWSWVRPEPILTDKEREYLKAVCKPFDIRYVMKKKGGTGEWLYISLINNDDIALPLFKKGTMYQGMEVDRSYTLEELGI